MRPVRSAMTRTANVAMVAMAAVVGLLVGLLVGPLAAPLAAQTGHLTGTVRAQSGRPVAAASITLVGHDVTSRSDSSGKFSMLAPADRPLRLAVLSPGFRADTFDVAPIAKSSAKS